MRTSPIIGRLSDGRPVRALPNGTGDFLVFQLRQDVFPGSWRLYNGEAYLVAADIGCLDANQVVPAGSTLGNHESIVARIVRQRVILREHA
jgi:hypothetical protein